MRRNLFGLVGRLLEHLAEREYPVFVITNPDVLPCAFKVLVELRRNAENSAAAGRASSREHAQRQ